MNFSIIIHPTKQYVALVVLTKDISYLSNPLIEQVPNISPDQYYHYGQIFFEEFPMEH